MTLVRFEPLREFEGFTDQIEKYFSDFPGFRSRREFTPRIDISETENQIIVEVEVPGVKKDDLNLRLEDNILTIEGEKQGPVKNENVRFHRNERIYGQFKRSFTLPVDVNPDKVSANYKDGILKVTLEKIEVETTKEKVIELK